jgi:uroporphyrinogen decarboxylase
VPQPAVELTRRERFLLTVRGEETDRPPIWIMRQAGRYMPEYQALRSQYGFRDFCLNPEVAAAATWLPFELLDVDILIIFNDILIPLEAMGFTVEFPEGGPRITNPVRSADDLDRVASARFPEPVVARSLQLIRERVGRDVPILGFAGAPFTMAAYAVEGKMSKDQTAIRRLMFEQPAVLHALMERIADTVVEYLVAQVEQGTADAVQLFESWGAVLPMPTQFDEFGTRYHRRVIEGFRKACPGVPVILYVRGSGGRIAEMASTGADVLGLDQYTSMAAARAATDRCIQGNLDPMTMVVPQSIDAAFDALVQSFDWRRGWIANLGHGITPDGTVDGVRRFISRVKGLAHG